MIQLLVIAVSKKYKTAVDHVHKAAIVRRAVKIGELYYAFTKAH
jgi:hypothetical protein